MAALTGVAVTQINGILFFGPPADDPMRVRALAGAWSLINALRVAATALTVAELVGIYTDDRRAAACAPGDVDA
ncbi:hypothetical protein QFZ82_007997 [Streptomyces sp. V4I23]|uniref:hypothetical protein n=1 Tax=Streptomyces sp. V4I23 TaxID=3042282 RepID=UPI00278531CF|nr:hypothetical protein [Streptomyces sp. V4I23]MDQ1013429.1 hypothetical protein [Streptomyces sp. V4I23]